MSSTEEWRPIMGCPVYEVSSYGRVRRSAAYTRSKMAQIRKLRSNKGSLYRNVTLFRSSHAKSFQVHRLVAAAFHGASPTPAHVVAHNNGDPTDNREANLRWATPAENRADQQLHGTDPSGERNPNAKLTDMQIRLIRARVTFGETKAEVGRLFDVSDSHVHSLVIGKLRRGAGGYGIAEEV